MSHLEERKEKNCLNCNAQVQGKYCHICGQENIETKESAWHLVSHFFQDITHFDGKFFNTLRYLIWRPGFLSREYMNGRRASYLNPVRMYVFTSAFFFLIFFSFFAMDENTTPIKLGINGVTPEEALKMDSTAFADYTRKINRQDHKPDIPMSREEFKVYAPHQLQTGGFYFSERKYPTVAAYDSALAAGTIKDGWVKRQFIYKIIEINSKYKNNSAAVLSALSQRLLHSLPQMLFISLPLLALLLRMLYFRRKQFFYVSHGIFSIHLYVFVFIGMLFLFGLGKLNDQLHWGLITVTRILLYIALFFYEYKAMRNFYQQRRGKTIAKFLLLNLAFLFLLLLLFTFFIFFSFFKI